MICTEVNETLHCRCGGAIRTRVRVNHICVVAHCRRLRDWPPFPDFPSRQRNEAYQIRRRCARIRECIEHFICRQSSRLVSVQPSEGQWKCLDKNTHLALSTSP